MESLNNWTRLAVPLRLLRALIGRDCVSQQPEYTPAYTSGQVQTVVEFQCFQSY